MLGGSKCYEIFKNQDKGIVMMRGRGAVPELGEHDIEAEKSSVASSQHSTSEQEMLKTSANARAELFALYFGFSFVGGGRLQSTDIDQNPKGV